MKKILTICVLLTTVLFVDQLIAQDFSGLDKSPADIAWLPGNRKPAPIAKVIYSRPQMKGRTMFAADSELAPAGKIWRTGANETTQITFTKDATFGGKKVKAGTYSLYSIPGDKWTVILNSKLNTWGHFEYDESKDVARVEVSARTNSGPEVEAFTIQFADPADGSTKSTMYLAWGNTIVDIPVEY